MKTGIVLTTINKPVVIERYLENFKKYGHKDFFFVIVGDLKTPQDLPEYFDALREKGADISYLDVPSQKKWLENYPELAQWIPYHSVQRRNIGYLYCAQLKADIIISIDDDNLPLMEYDYLGCHGIVGKTLEEKSVSSSSGWFNACSLLDTEPKTRFYHRGYPMKKRWIEETYSYTQEKKKVMVNVGLWLRDPDVDTITRLQEPFEVTRVYEPMSKLFIANDTMIPFNTQNTAFSSELIPCLFLITFNDEKELLRGNNNFRYDDIWMSYFMKKLIDHMGDVVCIGPPHVEQLRNPHNYYLDLYKETLPMEMTDPLVDLLDDIRLSATSYEEAYRELIDCLGVAIKTKRYFNESQTIIIEKMLKGMSIWLDAVTEKCLV